jgi:aldose sugar dehydrogenase
MIPRRNSITDQPSLSSIRRYCLRAGQFFAGLSILLACNNINLTAQIPTVVDRNLEVRTVVNGLVTPTTMVFLDPMDPNDFLVLEKNTGSVLRIQDGAIHSNVLQLPVNTASERGMLGIALHPDFPADPGVYIYWTESLSGQVSGDVSDVPLLGNRVDRFTWDGGMLTFDQNLILLRAWQPAFAFPPFGEDDMESERGNHDGGVIKFGPDGKLYIFIGDVGRRGWMQNVFVGKGPDGMDDQFGGPEPGDAHLTGVFLRLNDDGSIPEDNPFFVSGEAMIQAGMATEEVGRNIQKVFSYGHRNGFGFDFDPVSQVLWMGENGDDTYAEINRVLPGMNGGWIQIMGPAQRVPDYKAIETSPETDPFLGNAYFGLQQLRWPPTLIADTPQEALDALVMIPGAHYADPVLSWRFVIEPAGFGFLNSRALGPQYEGDLFVGGARPFIEDGHLFRLKLTGNRRAIAGKLVVDNSHKWDITGSEHLLFGTGFGVITDIKTSPNGNLIIVSLTNGAVYEIARRSPGRPARSPGQPAVRNFVAPADGSQEVPPVATRARGQAIFQLSKDGAELSYKLIVANLHNITQAHIHYGAAGVNGPVVAWLYPEGPPSQLIEGRFSGVLAEGTITGNDLVNDLEGLPLSALIDLMMAGEAYVNVHTSQYPGGEIRGQIRPAGPSQ